MVIDQHFGYIAFSWLTGIIGFAGIVVWILWGKKSLNRQLADLEAQGIDVSRAKDTQ